MKPSCKPNSIQGCDSWESVESIILIWYATGTDLSTRIAVPGSSLARLGENKSIKLFKISLRFVKNGLTLHIELIG